jgi:Leucine-rich repeat (LRR) protein
MYPIVNIFNRLPNNTRISKLSIVDCAMPIVSAALLTNVRPLQLRIEASTVRELAPDLFAQVGQRLKVIELKNNNLKKISARQFDKLEKLTTLDLSGNNLTQLTSKSFGSIASLERLFVQRNNISHVEDYTFAQLVNLKVLSLASNRIQRITGWDFSREALVKFLYLQQTHSPVSAHWRYYRSKTTQSPKLTPTRFCTRQNCSN